MNLQAVVGIVRAVGLCCAISLVGCDSGEKKAEEKKPDAKVEAKAEEKKPAPEEKKADVVEAKAVDPAANPTGDAKAPEAPAGDAKAPAGDAAGGDAKAAGIDGKPLYEAKCKVCHAADGKGTEAMKKNKIPDMSAGDWQSKHDKAEIVKAITDGVDGTKMKAFKDKLKPEEIEAIAVYVKGMK